MSFFPMGLGYIQAMLRSRGFPCRLANLSGLPKKRIAEYLRDQGPSLVGISMFTFNRARARDLVDVAREVCPGAALVAGGPHATATPGDVFGDCPGLDAIVKGEGETPMLEMARLMLRGGDWRGAPSLVFRDGAETTPAAPIADLDSIGLPAEHFEADFFDDTAQLGYISTSRGCPSDCSFCGTPAFWGRRVRFRSPGSVMREMESLWRGRGVAYFNVRDDTFTADKGRVLEICGSIARSDLHPMWSCQSRADTIDEDRLVAMIRAGCGLMQFGVEHGSERMLRLLGKGAGLAKTERSLSLVKKVGMNLGIYMITGIPSETWDDVAESEALIGRLRPHDVQLSPLAVYPGTRLHAELLTGGAITPDFYRNRDETGVWARPHKKDPRKGYDSFTAKALARLHRAADEAAAKARYTAHDFREQKKLLGWCATTSIICGEAAEEAGDLEEAMRQYTEITIKEPQSPWGWLRRARARRSLGLIPAARADYLEAMAIMPNNAEAIAGAAHAPSL
jgi:radical SAM superfamily enzyme YgiQ (UPF0313 family)